MRARALRQPLRHGGQHRQPRLAEREVEDVLAGRQLGLHPLVGCEGRRLRERHEWHPSHMSLPQIASRDEWLAARTELLEQEKELTRRRDALSAPRAASSRWSRSPRTTCSPDPTGEVGLADLFEGRRQLIVYHFMFDPSWDEGCPSCSAGTDELSNGFLDHLHTRDTTLACVSRAPLEKLEAWKAKKGWDIPWYSSGGRRLQLRLRRHDRQVARLARLQLPRRRRRAPTGPTSRTRCPVAARFLLVDDRIFHTYSQYARGLESTGGSYYFLDLTALGRQEDWEEPKGRADSARAAQPDFAT